jgi:hypothetical protein
MGFREELLNLADENRVIDVAGVGRPFTEPHGSHAGARQCGTGQQGKKQSFMWPPSLLA